MREIRINLNKYTKLVNSLMSLDKEYIGTITLGIKTDTFDITGKVLDKKDVNVSKDDIEKVFSSLIGKYKQVVPIYSAKKVNGKKLYEYARNGEEVNLPINEVDIYNLELISYEDNKIVFKCNCEKLNVIGTMSDLIRTKQGNFDISNTYTIKDIENGNYKVLSVKDLFDYKIYNLNEDEYNKVKNGSHIKIDSNEDKLLLYYNNEEVAIYKKKDEFYVCDIMLI